MIQTNSVINQSNSQQDEHRFVLQLEKLLDQSGQERCLRQAFKPVLGVAWPWPLTSWYPKLTVSCPCPRGPLVPSCQLPSKSIHSLTKYRVHEFGKGRTNGRTDGRIIIIIIISKTMFMVRHHATVHPVHLMNVERRQAAADPRPSQTT